MRGCDSHLRLAERVTVSFECVFVCVGVHAEADCCGPVSLHASMCVCACVSCIQYVCLPAHGLWSKTKAQERQAAGVQFGAVSC